MKHNNFRARLRKKFKGKPNLLTRLVLGKLLGLGLGGTIFLTVPSMVAEPFPLLGWGFLCWYVLFGSMIGLAGIFDKHPLFGWSFGPLLRGALLGGLMHLGLGLLMADTLAWVAQNYPFSSFSAQSPVIGFVFEGVIWGIIFDLVCTRYGGQGKKLVQSL